MSGEPSSRTVPAMNGILENFPAAKSFEGRSGMRPSAPSITGTKRFEPPVRVNVSAACCQEATSVAVSALCKHGNVSSSAASAHSETPAVKLSQAGLRCDAL